jgi:hypothetical protein
MFQGGAENIRRRASTRLGRGWFRQALRLRRRLDGIQSVDTLGRRRSLGPRKMTTHRTGLAFTLGSAVVVNSSKPPGYPLGISMT